jgi:hypothetical protein
VVHGGSAWESIIPSLLERSRTHRTSLQQFRLSVATLLSIIPKGFVLVQAVLDQEVYLRTYKVRPVKEVMGKASVSYNRLPDLERSREVVHIGRYTRLYVLINS